MSLLESNTEALERLMEEVNNLPNPNPNGASVQTDWNQTDETAPDFLKNKPFGDELTVILEEQELTYDEEMECFSADFLSPVNSNETIIVMFDGDKYELATSIISGMIVFGNMVYIGGEDTGEPFCGFFDGTQVALVTTDTNSHTVGMYKVAITAIPNKYLPRVEMYTDQSHYIYKSLDGTKATKDDIPEKSNVVLGYIAMGTLISWCTPISVDTDEFSSTNGFRRLIAIDPITLEEVCYYTAEYVHETTT